MGRSLDDLSMASVGGMTQDPNRQACAGGPTDEVEDSTEAVWHNPAGYDMVRHGPPYLPRQASHTAPTYSYDRRVSRVTTDD